jgi:hypothetical protein
MEKQYIYILGNTKNPEIIKVGETNRHPETRATELSKATGTIGKYFVEWYMEVSNCKVAEKIAHFKLDEFRIDKDKEQFEISALKAHRILEKFIIPLFELNPPIIFYSESLKEEIRKEHLKVKYETILKKQEEELKIVTDEEIKQKNRKERIKIAEKEAEEFTSSERKKRIENASEIAVELSKQYNKEERIKKFQEQAKEYALSEREERIKNASEKLKQWSEDKNDK